MNYGPFLIVALIAGYLVGSVSFAVLIARMKGLDIFKVGSGNPGATNVLRALGKPYGYGCFLLDAFKGAVAVFLGLGIGQAVGSGGEALAIAALLGAILGHSFSLFLRFRGGKGVATTIGGLLVLLPVVLLVGLVLWLLVFYASKYVSLASLILGASLPLTAWVTGKSDLMIGLCLFLALLIFVRHIANIRRLLKGTEHRAGEKKP
ncbi:MAG: glycerol-3-phosphate 1-O-acyltransferase PlsY [Verrucomicrobia bacterium]|jgi:glycerol-3-phosphate acyltransferase PlsY|nr:glycerol-3-phosphate 1-O-acyltransferase PlsY [Verrucomicrobiota bacterium]